MDSNRIGFFKRIILSISDMNFYPYILKEKFITALRIFYKINSFV